MCLKIGDRVNVHTMRGYKVGTLVAIHGEVNSKYGDPQTCLIKFLDNIGGPFLLSAVRKEEE